MKQIIKNFRKFTCAFLCLSILSGTLPFVHGQQNKNSSTLKIIIPNVKDTIHSFERMLEFGRGAEFIKVVERELGAGKAQTAFAWFDEKDKSFFNAVFETHNQRAKSFIEKRLQSGQSKNSNVDNAPPAKVAPRSPSKKRASLEMLPGGGFVQNAAYRAFDNESGAMANVAAQDEEPQVTTVETADGIKTVGEVVNKIETAETIVTKGSNAEAGRIVTDAKNGGTYTQTSFEEIFNKQTRGRVRNDKKLQWNFLLAQCPDADGLVEGEATVVVENKATIANTQTIAIPKQHLTMKVKLKGYVDDEAKLTHYDMTGEVIETTSGYDRAKRLEMIDESAFADGTRQLSISVTGNKIIGTNAEKTGVIKEGETWHLTTAENNRLVEFVDTALPMNLINAENGFSDSQTNWQNGFCVGVSLAAPKERLLPGEKTSVSAETVHKLDGSKVNARLKASGFEVVTPETQNAEPTVSFSLTASRTEQVAEISVKSTSRRGIGTATLGFKAEKPKKDPPKKIPPPRKTPPLKNCGWAGDIKVVKRKLVESSKPADGRLISEIEKSEETFVIDYSLSGIRDTTQGLTNGSFAAAQTNYRNFELREKKYAAGKMSCDKQIITSPQTQKLESLVTALSNKQITVYVTVAEKGILTFDSPEINAERTITRKYETICPSYDRVNSSVERSDGLINVPNPGFEIEFELDSKNLNHLVGSKTVQNSDGSETVVAWNLTRECK